MDGPVIIGGMERSGTSLTRAILGSHPDLAIFQYDLPLWRRFHEQYSGRVLSLEDCRALLERIVTHRKAEEAEKTPDVQSVLNVLSEKAEERIRCGDVFGAYLRTYAEIRGRPRWGWKRPLCEFYADSIFDAFPKATFVHLIRDPRDVTVSMMNTDFTEGRIDLSLSPRHFRTSGMLALWQMSVDAAVQNQRQFPNRYHVVKYEDITADTVDTVSSLCDACGLTYDSDILAMRGHPGWEGSNSQIDVEEGFEIRDRGKRYPEYLDTYQMAFIEDTIGDAMSRMGYGRDQLMHASERATWKSRILHINYAIEPALIGLRKIYVGFRKAYRVAQIIYMNRKV